MITKFDKEYIKNKLKKEYSLFLMGNLKFLYRVYLWIFVPLKFLLKLHLRFGEWIICKKIKIDPMVYNSLSWTTRKIDETVMEADPNFIHYVEHPNYEDKLKAIKRIPSIIFLIKYPSTEMVVEFLKNDKYHNWEYLKSVHQYLKDSDIEMITKFIKEYGLK